MRALLEQLARENGALKEQLMHMATAAATAGAPGAPATSEPTPLGRNSTTSEPAALAVFIATLLVLCCFLPADKAMLLGAAVPVLLAALVAQQQRAARRKNAQPPKDVAFDMLICFLAQARVLTAKSRGLRHYLHATFYKRSVYCGVKLGRALAHIADSQLCASTVSVASFLGAVKPAPSQALIKPSTGPPTSLQEELSQFSTHYMTPMGALERCGSHSPNLPERPASATGPGSVEFDVLDFFNPLPTGVYIKHELVS